MSQRARSRVRCCGQCCLPAFRYVITTAGSRNEAPRPVAPSYSRCGHIVLCLINDNIFTSRCIRSEGRKTNPIRSMSTHQDNEHTDIQSDSPATLILLVNASLTSGLCSSPTVLIHAAAGSPDPARLPCQYSFPGNAFPSQA